jgi:hypothetical protein
MREYGRAGWITLLVVAACSRDPRSLEFRWNVRVVCSRAIDDKLGPVQWVHIDHAMSTVAITRGVLAFHAHVPGLTVSREAVDHLLDLAAAHGLPTLTFRELARSRVPRAGIALAFDDNTPAAWEAIAQVLTARGAHATFFVTEWDRMTDSEREVLHRLAGAGHDIEPHGRDHVHAPAYAADYGVAAYVEDEALPSLRALRADGFGPANAFAYPYGEHTEELDAAMLAHVPLVRVGAAQCPR